MRVANSYDYLLIGAGVASYNAAKRIRRSQPDAKVLMVGDDRLPPYDLPPLSKEYLRGVKTDADILYPSFEALKLAPVDIMLGATVEDLDAGAHVAHLGNGGVVAFGKALLATGTSPIRLAIPGADLPQVFYLRTAAQSRSLAAAATTAQRAVVIGAGFIGLETAASLAQMGLAVTVIEAMPRIWPRFIDAELGGRIQAYVQARGIDFRLGAIACSIEGGAAVEAVTTASGERIACDLVCIGVGVRPNDALARAAGLTVLDGIVVDARMQTSASDIFAAGDVAMYPDPIAGRTMRAEHWGHAEYSGQIAGRNMVGDEVSYDFVNYAWSDLFDLHIEAAGHIERFDDIIIRGEADRMSYTSLYFREGILLGYCGVNADQSDFAAYRRLIRNKTAISASRTVLTDQTIKPKNWN